MNKEQQKFESWSLIEQAEYTLKFGVFITHRVDKKHLIKLYAVDDFFVELWYRHFNNHIFRIRSFDCDQIFHRYGDNINIQDIFS
jgi:hypothetical protein